MCFRLSSYDDDGHDDHNDGHDDHDDVGGMVMIITGITIVFFGGFADDDDKCEKK